MATNRALSNLFALILYMGHELVLTTSFINDKTFNCKKIVVVSHEVSFHRHAAFTSFHFI